MRINPHTTPRHDFGRQRVTVVPSSQYRAFQLLTFSIRQCFMRLAKAIRMPLGKVVGVYMKKEFLKVVKKVFAPVALVVGLAAFSPAAALAQGHEGGHGGGHGYSGGRGGYSGGGHSYAAPRNFSGGGRGHSGGGYSGGVRGGYYGGRGYYGDRGYYGGGYYGGRGYYGPGFGFDVYAPYGYAAPVCNPSGFCDQYGNWQLYRGCAVPYGY